MNPIWPFNRRPREAKSAPLLVALSEVGAARWGSRDGAALTRDGYLANAIAYRAVRMVAEAAAAVPLVTAHEGVALDGLAPTAMRPVADAGGWVEAWTVRERHGEQLIRRGRLRSDRIDRRACGPSFDALLVAKPGCIAAQGDPLR
jgi:hypothetical protein